MIATPVRNRAHDPSRGSREAHAPDASNTETNTAPPIPSPVADGGGAKRSEAEGVFVHPPSLENALPTEPNDAQQPLDRALGASRGSFPTQTDVLPSNEPNDAQPIPTLPEGKNLSRFLDAFLDGSFSIPSICDEFELTLEEVLALLESTEVQNALETLKKIATIRQDTIATQARATAILRLSELATYAHTADAVEARAFETARKTAAQIIRTTNPKRKPSARRQHEFPAQPENVPRSLIDGARRPTHPLAMGPTDSPECEPAERVRSERYHTKADSSESYPTNGPAVLVGSEIRRTCARWFSTCGLRRGRAC